VVNPLLCNFSLLVQAELPTGGRRSVGHSFNINAGAQLEEIREFLTPYIENFEAQSGSGEVQTQSTVVQIYNITESPNPEAQPFSSDSTNLQWVKTVRADAKRTADRARKSTKTSSVDP
jgi:hypothetical protein